MTEPLPETPPPEIRYRRGFRLGAARRDLWANRHVVYNLGHREVRVKYSQAVLGFAWALMTPLALMIVFTVFLKRVTTIDTHGIPYPVFSYTGLLAWTFFAGAIGSAANVLIGNPLLNKVYAPREVFVLATMGTSGVDALLASIALGGLFIIYGVVPQATTVWVPVLLLVLVMFTVGVGLFLASVTVYLRDIRHALPLLLQVGLFVTPVIYGIDKIPKEWRGIYVFFNPVAMVIDNLRRTVLYGESPQFQYLGIASVSATIALVVGYMVFKQLETGFADVS